MEIDNDCLKRCPFCAGRGVIAVYGKAYTALCENCGIETPRYATRREAVENWNRRAYELLHEAISYCAMQRYTRAETETVISRVRMEA